MQDIALLLPDIRSAHNVGSIFRTADAAGVSRIYLGGYTPAPVDRFGRAQKEIAKTALGAEVSVPWEYCPDALSLIDSLRSERLIVGVEQDERAVDYRALSRERPLLFVFGSEVEGLSESLRDRCDVLAEIPQFGKKESLNVSVAAGIVLFSAR